MQQSRKSDLQNLAKNSVLTTYRGDGELGNQYPIGGTTPQPDKAGAGDIMKSGLDYGIFEPTTMGGGGTIGNGGDYQ